jgi:NADH-quinone oxidoreductase subunit J
MEVWQAAAFYGIAALLTAWSIGLYRQRALFVLPGLGVAALLAFVAAWVLIGHNVGSFAEFLFYVLSAVAVSAALLMVTSQNPVYAALWLVLVILSIAVLLVLLHAEFFAAVQVIVYAGAIMVLYLFTIMMVEMPEKPSRPLWMPRHTLVTVIGVLLFGSICAILARRPLAAGILSGSTVPAPEGNTVALGRSLFTEYLFPFEVASLLLLAALVGAIVLAKKEADTENPGEGDG